MLWMRNGVRIMKLWSTVDWRDALVTLGLPITLFLLFHHLPGVESVALLGIALALTWLRPDIALTLLPLALPFYSYVRPIVPHHLYTTPLFVELVFCIVAVAGQTLIGPQRRAFRTAWRRLPARFAPLALPTGLLMIAATFALTLSHTYDSRTLYLQTCAEPYIYAVLLLLVLHTRGDLLRLITAILLAGLEVTVNAFYQASYFTPAQVWRLGNARFRAQSFFVSPNQTGAFLEFIVVVLAALILLDWSRRSRWRLALIPLLAVLLVGLYMSQSRGAWMAVGVTVLILLALVLPRQGRLVLGGIVVVGLALVGPALLHSLWTGHSGTAQSRVFIWLAALHMIADHPLRGIGFARFLLLYSPAYSHHPYWIPSYHGTTTAAATDPHVSQAHNVLLNFWLNIGILGVISYLWLLCQLARAARRRSHFLWQLATPEALLTRRMMLGLCLGVLALTLHGLIDDGYFTQELTMLIWATIAVVLVSAEPDLVSGPPYIPLPFRARSARRPDRARERAPLAGKGTTAHAPTGTLAREPHRPTLPLDTPEA